MGVRVYVADILNIDDPLCHPEWKDCLEPGRWDRLSGYRKEEDRKRGAAAGWLLKYAMKKEGFDPKIPLPVKTNRDKPYLPEIGFNLSHSGDYAVCAVSDCEVGCDIEKVRQGYPRLIQKYFSKEEQQKFLLFTTQEEKDRYFTRLWTLREAYAKKTGEGLVKSLDGLYFLEDEKIKGFRKGKELSEIFWSYQMGEYIISVCGEETVDKIEYPDIEQMDWS